MFKKLVCLMMVLMLMGCEGVRRFGTSKGNTFSPYSSPQNIRPQGNNFKILGTVNGEYTKTCVLLNLICVGDELFIFDDLLKKGKAMGADTIVNVNVDPEHSSPFWAILFYKEAYRANGIAIKFVR